MALTELRSDLSWYGKTAPGFRPNKDRNTTDFQYNADLTSTVAEQGFSERGEAVGFRRITSMDAFAINSGQDAQGTARRLTQLGAGSKFPVGPFGDVHEFDKARTGFSPVSRYGDIYSAKTTAGLADTYTANSPIDDMYNRYKVRDEAYNPFPYAREPFILRGIQRDDNSDPQRWGILPDVRSEIPRGGAVTAVQRLAIDAARIGKFLITPNGLSFIAKQTALHLMSPNTEGVTGGAKNGLLNKPVYNPLSVFSNMTTHVASNVQALRYGDIFNARKPFGNEVSANRLVRLRNERGIANVTWGTLSAPTGPNTFGGIGATTFFAPWSNNTSYDKILIDDSTITYDDFIRIRARRDTFFNPYQKVKDLSSNRSREDIDDNNISLLNLGTIEQSLKKRVDTDKQFKGFTKEPTENPPDADNRLDRKLDEFNVLSYNQIRAITRDRVVSNNPKILDHTTGKAFNVAKLPMSKFINTKNDKTLQSLEKDPFAGLCKFSIIDIPFKAYIQSIGDDISRKTQSTDNPDAAVAWDVYAGYSRALSIDFTVPIERREDFNAIWKKLNRLGSLAGQSVNSLPRKGRCRIGDFINMYGFIESLNISWDNESPWEITDGSQAPLYTNVSMNFRYQPDQNQQLDITSFTPPALYNGSMPTPANGNG